MSKQTISPQIPYAHIGDAIVGASEFGRKTRAYGNLPLHCPQCHGLLSWVPKDEIHGRRAYFRHNGADSIHRDTQCPLYDPQFRDLVLSWRERSTPGYWEDLLKNPQYGIGDARSWLVTGLLQLFAIIDRSIPGSSNTDMWQEDEGEAFRIVVGNPNQPHRDHARTLSSLLATASISAHGARKVRLEILRARICASSASRFGLAFWHAAARILDYRLTLPSTGKANKSAAWMHAYASSKARAIVHQMAFEPFNPLPNDANLNPASSVWQEASALLVTQAIALIEIFPFVEATRSRIARREGADVAAKVDLVQFGYSPSAVTKAFDVRRVDEQERAGLLSGQFIVVDEVLSLDASRMTEYVRRQMIRWFEAEAHVTQERYMTVPMDAPLTTIHKKFLSLCRKYLYREALAFFSARPVNAPSN